MHRKNEKYKIINYISKSHDETRQIGASIAANIKGGEIICLFGELGAGKTTFADGFINFFVKTKRVLSPTFIIVRHYPVYHFSIRHIYHIDLYRLANTAEVVDLGLTELTNDSRSVFLIEWPEKIKNFLTKNRIEIRFLTRNESERKIQICYPKI